jgi:CubicO group peptidase (beta-lactamase class C family)
MKSTCFRVIILLLSFTSLKTFAQSGPQQKHDSVFLLLKKYINDGNTNLIYTLASEQYKIDVSESILDAFFQKEIYSLGQIKQSSFINLKGDTSSYKLIFESRKFEFSFALDKNNRFTFLSFTPFKAVITNKAVPVATSNPLKSILDKQIDSVARIYIQKSNTVGLSIGILKEGKIHTYNYGETEKAKGKLPDEHTVFEIGSITKTFTAAILAYYVNEGKISLSDPITKYLPDSVAVNPELQKIKILNLSNHTSGLASLPDNFFNKSTDLLNPYKNYTEGMFFADLKKSKLKSVPGEVYAYSNQAVGLLGIILERISGRTFEQLVKQVITGPLKMNNTLQHLPPVLADRTVKVYNADSDETSKWDFDALTACGSLRSTVSDLLIYAKNNIQSEYPDLSKSFNLTHETTFPKGPVVGLGWHLSMINGNKNYWHMGGTGGSSSFLIFNIKKNIAVVVLSNAAVDTDAVGMNILKKML